MSWEKKTLDQLGHVSRGKSKHRPRNDAKLFGGQYPFIQTADVKNANFYINEYSQTYSDFGLAQSKLWYEGTLCITIAANIADTAILGIKACFPDSIMGFIPYEGVSDVRFIKYMFDVLQKECQNISQGTAQDNLSWEKLSTIKFCVPDYETQQRIANILYAYDELIENNHKQIKLLEEAAQRLYKEWFVDLHFPGYENAKIVDGVPEGWRVMPISSVADLKAGGDKPKDFSLALNNDFNIPVYTNGVSNKGLIGYTNKAVVTKPSVTISARGTVGVVFFRSNPYVPIVRLISVVPKEESMDAFYLYLSLQKQKFRFTGSAQQQITIPLIIDRPILCPSNNIRQMFHVFVKPIFNKLDVLEKQIEVLKEARDRLLPKLMSGEIEV